MEFLNQDQSRQIQPKMIFPFITLALTGTACAIHYYWGIWNYARARQHFVVAEMNLTIHNRWESAFLSPLSFQSPFLFWLSLPGLIYSAFLIERAVGSISLIGAIFGNCITSLLTTIIYHRQIGFKEVMKRGRMSNNNGNTVMFLSTLFATLIPNYYLLRGRSVLT